MVLPYRTAPARGQAGAQLGHAPTCYLKQAQMPPEHSPPCALHIVLYVKSLPVMARFYESVLGLVRLDSGQGFSLFSGGAFELSLVEMPPPWADTVAIAKPPVPREETPIKFSLLVDDLEALRAGFEQAGAALKPASQAWCWRQQLHLDGIDPEGNVIQLRQRQPG